VGFDARYYPLQQVRTAVPVVLQKIDVAAVNPRAGPTPGFLTGGVVDTSAELGATYNALFSSQYVSYDLAVKTFTGETVVATPAQAPNASIVKVSALETNGPFKRVTVSFGLPW
jgi:hypothetical protein